MAGVPRKIPDQPKLRTSCDRCGAAKVRCDRGQPECERCVSHGRACVYGVSRKIGGRPRQKLRTLPGQANVRVAPKTDNGRVGDAWEAVDKSSHDMGLDATQDLFSNLNGPLAPNFPLLDVNEWVFTNHLHHNHASGTIHAGSLPIPESTDLGSRPTTESPTARLTPCELPQEQIPPSDSGINLTMSHSGHDCSRGAHEILRNLSFLNVSKSESTPSSGAPSTAAASSSERGAIANQVPLDDVLRLNYEARERLSALLACSCAKSSDLALVHAAIISRVLMWYQKAAGGTQGASGSDGAVQDDTLNMLAVTPVKMAIGTFEVDDVRIQTAWKMQLLSGEMKRAGRLIDQFLAPNSGGEAGVNSVDGLYRSLHAWLSAEHSRIMHQMTLKLQELNN